MSPWRWGSQPVGNPWQCDFGQWVKKSHHQEPQLAVAGREGCGVWGHKATSRRLKRQERQWSEPVEGTWMQARCVLQC